jgi:hypothetical protein
MRKLLVILSVLFLNSCEPDYSPNSVTETSHKSHFYLIFRQGSSFTYVHDPDCGCNSKGLIKKSL